jgi:hypothetical protein
MATALTMLWLAGRKLQDHEEFPDFGHGAPPSRQGEEHRQDSRLLGPQALAHNGASTP